MAGAFAAAEHAQASRRGKLAPWLPLAHKARIMLPMCICRDYLMVGPKGHKLTEPLRARSHVPHPMVDLGPARQLVLLLTAAALVLTPGCARLTARTEPTPTPAATATPQPRPAWEELSTYRSAMVPTATGDVELVEAPTFYYIRARLDMSGETPHVRAEQTTLYRNHTGTALDSLYFRLWPNKPSYGSALTFDSVSVGGQAAELAYEAEGTAVAVQLPEALVPQEAVAVEMKYEVTVPVDNARGYGTYNYQDGVLLLSNFFAMVAVYDPDGWNLSVAADYGDPVYAETSFYTLEFTAPQTMTVITSGSTSARKDNGDGTVTWTCVSGPMRDLMVVVSDRFEVTSYALGYVRVNSYYLPEHKDSGQQVLAYARDSLRAYGQSFGPYPFAEFDVVEAPISAGGMEYPGLVMLAVGQYQVGGEYLEFLATHEVAHQWWYSLVGNDQVNVPWLDESLTNFSVVYYYEYVYGSDRALLVFRNYVRSRYEQARESGQDDVVNQPVEAFSPGQYGAIVYGKGAVFFYELRLKLGDDVFLEVLRSYLQDRKYRLATPEDLVRVAEQVSGQELDDFYAQWVLGAEQP